MWKSQAAGHILLKLMIRILKQNGTYSLLQVFPESTWEGVYKIIFSGTEVRNYGNMVERERGKNLEGE